MPFRQMLNFNTFHPQNFCRVCEKGLGAVCGRFLIKFYAYGVGEPQLRARNYIL